MSTQEAQRTDDLAEPTEERAQTGRDLEAEAAIAARLRADTSVQGLYDVLVQNPDIRAEVAEVQQRRDSLNTTGTRAYSAELIALSLSARGSELLDLTIEQSIANRSAELKEALRTGNVHVHELLIGSGVHACIYNSERAQVLPHNPNLTVDRAERIGGQFAQTEECGWRLNTRTRPENPDLPNLPGTAGSLNSLEGAPVQQADLTGDAYATQKTLADAVRISHLLVSEIINSCELTHVSKVSEPGETPLYSTQFRDTQSGEEYTLRTDRIVFTTGLGRSVTGLEKADAETQALLAEERAKTEAGEHPQVSTVDEYMQMVGDDAESFPLKGQSRIAVVGAGDSGATVVEFATGHGTSTRKSTSQIDRVSEVIWVGQKAATREEFLKKNRERYSEVSLEMPREHAPDYPHRIKTIPDRCIGLRKVGDEIELIYGDRNGTETGRLRVDHVILATGMKDSTDEILSGVSQDPLGRELFYCHTDQDNAVAKKIQGENIFLAGPAAGLELTPRDKQNSPALSRMGVTKTPAVWAYVDETALLARELAATDILDGTLRPDIASQRVKRQVVELPPLPLGGAPNEQPLLVPRAPEAQILPTGANSSDILQLLIAQEFLTYAWPDGMEKISISIERQGDEFAVTAADSLIAVAEYRNVINSFLTSAVVQEVCSKLTDPRHNRSQRIDITVPIRGHKAKVGGLTVTPGV